MAEETFPAFLLDAAEWLSDSHVRMLDPYERGLHIDLLCFAWRDGSVPADPKLLSRMLGITPARFSTAWKTVGRCWRKHPDDAHKLVSPYLERCREHVDNLREKRAEAGRKGARRRWQSHSFANGKPMTNDGKDKDNRKTADEPDGSSGAGPTTRDLDRQEQQNPMGEIVTMAKEKAWLGSEPPGSDWSVGRELSVWKPLLDKGLSREDVLLAYVGARRLADLGQLVHVPRGGAFTSRVFTGKYGARDALPLAIAAGRKLEEQAGPQTRRAKAGFSAMGDALTSFLKGGGGDGEGRRDRVAEVEAERERERLADRAKSGARP